MLTVKAKHATMLLTVSDVEGLSDGMDELSDEELPSAGPSSKQLPAHPSVVMVSGKTLTWTHPGRHMYMLHGCPASASHLYSSISLLSQSAHTSHSQGSVQGAHRLLLWIGVCVGSFLVM